MILRYLLLPLVLLCCLTACAGAESAASQPTAGAREIAHPAPVSATAAIGSLAGNLARAYQRSDWSGVHRLFLDGRASSALVSQMRLWRASRVGHLHVTPTYIQHLGGDRYVVTLRFFEDPRVVPVYGLYLVQLGSLNARIAGVTSGLQATSTSPVRWSVTRTTHFTIYHSPYEVQGSDRQYLAGLEEEWQQVRARFHVQLPTHIDYFLYPTTQLMGKLTGGACGGSLDNVGCANPLASPPTIRTSLWPTYHEPIHVYQLALEPRPHGGYIQVAPLFVAEGMAVALEDRHADPNLSDYCSSSTLVYAPLDSCAQVAITQTHAINLLTDHGFSHGDPGNAYTLAGSFAKYLMLTYGYPAYGKFYYDLAAQPSDTLKDYNSAAYPIYHHSIITLLSDWQRHLCPHGCR